MGYFSNEEIKRETDKEVYNIDNAEALRKRREILNYAREYEERRDGRRGEQILEELKDNEEEELKR